MEDEFTIKVLDASKEYVQANGANMIKVTVGVYKGTRKVDTRSFHYPVDVRKGELNKELKRFIKTYNNDYRLGKESAIVEKAEQEADAAIADIKDSIIE